MSLGMCRRLWAHACFFGCMHVPLGMWTCIFGHAQRRLRERTRAHDREHYCVFGPVFRHAHACLLSYTCAPSVMHMHLFRCAHVHLRACASVFEHGQMCAQVTTCVIRHAHETLSTYTCTRFGVHAHASFGCMHVFGRRHGSSALFWLQL